MDRLLDRINEAYTTKWPMKEGKTRGMKKLSQTLKTVADVDAFLSAMDAYMVMKKDTPIKFWMRWHTFCNNWTDYLDPKITGSVSSNQTQLERIMKGEL